LLVEEVAFAIGVEDTEVVVSVGARHAARTAVGEGEFTEDSKSFAGFHKSVLISEFYTQGA